MLKLELIIKKLLCKILGHKQDKKYKNNNGIEYLGGLSNIYICKRCRVESKKKY